ncbi:aminodeoxychorismate synthase component I [Psychromicrobium sp. YIM B11713]|uniref:aminodeoxychorismate synthase component I n=1 Tax=Psychromicrobium sp. YIM B11713 TaxID=3145233 RepID=UPI00374EBBDB
MSEPPLTGTSQRSTRRPLLIAIDGRSGAGKTSLALELASLLREHREVSLFHLEDVYPGWNGLAAGVDRYVQTVLTPLNEGRDARWISWDWQNHFDGAVRETAAAPIVIVEGVGVAHSSAAAFLDVVIWVHAADSVRKERALARDGENYAPYWDRWAAQETELLIQHDPAETAAILVDSAAGSTPVEPTDVLLALCALPELSGLLAPEISAEKEHRLRASSMPFEGDTLGLFTTLYGSAEHSVWLDSSDAAAASGRNRFSVMADDDGPLGQYAWHSSGVTRQSFRGVEVKMTEPFFHWLDRRWGSRQPGADPVVERIQGERPGVEAELGDRGFKLGWLGYLGYELKRETGGTDHQERSSQVPDAALIFAGRAVVVDHQEKQLWALSLGPDQDHWAETVQAAARSTSTLAEAAPEPATGPPTVAAAPRVRDDVTAYKAKIALAQGQIVEGNSYEVCLTTAVEFEVDAEPLVLYSQLRRTNPAPFASYLRFEGLAVLSSSPERFLSVSGDGALTAEPIKGTRPRDVDPVKDAALHDELAHSAKDQAENVMIVDLMRNDLSHFAEPESVKVSRLFAVESYASVHQLVSTVEARLRRGASRAEAVSAAFPAGSMTGAPKISTMNILDDLESRPRGVYSGAIGYFSRDGSCDLSVVIRTLVLQGTLIDGGAASRWSASLGVGGAITADSVPEEEWQEVGAKASGVLRALGLEFPAG